MEFTCEDFKVGKCEGEKLVDGETMPLVLQPPEPSKNDLNTLLSALEKNKDWLGETIIKNSAVLLRGFDIKEHRKKVVLYCEIPPPEGSETPFTPSFRVTEQMLEEFPEVVAEIEEKGLKYTFIALSKKDTSSMRGRGWEDAFGTSDRRSREKGRRMWFNTVVSMHGKELSSATMADGSEIPERVVKRCGEIIEEESIQFKWQKGDVLFLDNLALLHGRRPSLPPRKVLVATCK
ncbi:Clavaminate synthase-like protein [Actinidia chinensis var. chinensis]|uniref:Clavaminate synthase-like protein n=1 Tax=Actinidia chinensis var. chinensis TaxID=1590841 RepID=A0A2R6QQM4_ACTCC|nr:Clavaminate synthase-like protein [Actinidia chinensis var. chinensis]